MRFRKIVAATDFSEASALALDAAIALAGEQGATLHVLHVVEEPVMAAAWTEGYTLDLPTLHENLVEEAERSLTVIQAAHPGVHITTQALVGRPADTILEVASEQHADLVVVGSHGRGGLTRLLLGSVAENVVRHAPCAVLTVRAALPHAVLEHAAAGGTAHVPARA
jgi:nucleotide-binding universal stress UspA family protein